MSEQPVYTFEQEIELWSQQSVTVYPKAKPFLKWAGGKRQIMPDLLRHVPQKYNNYFEPFLGGGALFFELSPKMAIVSDINLRLIRTYRAIRDDVDGVIELLQKCKYEKDFFYHMRDIYIDSQTDTEVAAWMIFLNKTGFNGLYRVNRFNTFNVPFGKYTNPTICDVSNLKACSLALEAVDILHEDFSGVLKRAKKGDFVYMDPPYVPASKTASFSAYSAEGFFPHDQIRLRDFALELKKRGVKVLLSNSSTDYVKKLYSEGFDMEEVNATRNISCKGNKRDAVKELIIW